MYRLIAHREMSGLLLPGTVGRISRVWALMQNWTPPFFLVSIEKTAPTLTQEWFSIRNTFVSLVSVHLYRWTFRVRENELLKELCFRVHSAPSLLLLHIFQPHFCSSPHPAINILGCSILWTASFFNNYILRLPSLWRVPVTQHCLNSSVLTTSFIGRLWCHIFMRS